MKLRPESSDFRLLANTYHRWSWFSLMIGLIAFWVSACGSTLETPSNQQNSTIESPISSSCQIVDHDFGETEICGRPQRVIALDPYALDLLLALGVNPVGYAEDRRALLGAPDIGEVIITVKYLGDRITQAPKHVGTWQAPSLEAILELQPDLILRKYLDTPLYRNLSKIAAVLLPTNDPTPEQWQQNLLTLGEIMNREQQAQQVIKTYKQAIENTKDELELIRHRQPVLLLSMTGLDYIGIFNDETFAGALLEKLGFQLLLPEGLTIKNGEVIVSLETLSQLEPESIFVMASGDSSVEQVKTIWSQNLVLQALPASQSKQVYFVDYQLWSSHRRANCSRINNR